MQWWPYICTRFLAWTSVLKPHGMRWAVWNWKRIVDSGCRNFSNNRNETVFYLIKLILKLHTCHFYCRRPRARSTSQGLHNYESQVAIYTVLFTRNRIIIGNALRTYQWCLIRSNGTIRGGSDIKPNYVRIFIHCISRHDHITCPGPHKTINRCEWCHTWTFTTITMLMDLRDF